MADDDLLDWDDDDINDIEASDETPTMACASPTPQGASAACVSGARSCAIAGRS